ncbi:MAG TPA: kinase [Desulfovibrio sp.]|nr:kinase [Desulfovibrio sp.]
MIISKTPYRISFFGGGTDYPGWYNEHGGQVLSTSIDKYCYITCRYLPPFFEHRLRVVYSQIESCQHIDEIKHPAVRETLRFLKFAGNLEIHHDGDLPARSGMGSSSSFTVGMLNALYALRGKMTNPRRLGREAIYIEQKMIKEVVGSQDQIAAAYGGLNHIKFHRNSEISVRPVVIPSSRSKELSDHLMLFYTGIMRYASEVAGSYVNDLGAKHELLTRMGGMVNEGVRILSSGKDISYFGQLLDLAWQAKRRIGDKIANPVIDEFYNSARKAGALGGKLTGAGGGGFLLLFVPPEKQQAVREELCSLLHIPFGFDIDGSQIIFSDPRIDDYCDFMKQDNVSGIDEFCELEALKTKK